jgi:hypothetical protein
VVVNLVLIQEYLLVLKSIHIPSPALEYLAVGLFEGVDGDALGDVVGDLVGDLV